MIPVADSTYTYATLGSLPAWIIGWDLVLEFAMAASTVAVGWSGYAQSLAADFGLRLPASLASAPGCGGIIDLPAAAITCALTLLLMREARDAAMGNTIMVALKVAIILGFIVVGAAHVKPELWPPLVPPNEGAFGAFGLSDILRGAGVVFFAYIGFETISCATAETRNPQRDAPIGLIGALIVSTLLYVAVAIVLTALVPYKALNVPDPIAKATDTLGLDGFGLLIKVGALIGLTTACLTALYGQGRIFYAMARDRMLPDIFPRLHPETRAPRISQATIGLVTATVAAVFPIDVLGELVSVGTLFAFILVCSAIMILRRTEPEQTLPFRVTDGNVLPVLGVLPCLALIGGLPSDT